MSDLDKVIDVDLKKMVLIYFDDEPKEGYTGKHSFTEQGELVIVYLNDRQ